MALSMNCGRISSCNTGGIQAYDRGSRTNSARQAGRAEIRTSTDSSTLTLKVKTDEGDTVEISLAARSQQTSARASWRGEGGLPKASEQKSSQSFSAQVKVDGDLSDQEVQDIRGLLQSLSSDQEAADPADTSLAAYDYSYTRTREVSGSSISMLA